MKKKKTLHKRGMGVVCTISDTLVLWRGIQLCMHESYSKACQLKFRNAIFVRVFKENCMYMYSFTIFEGLVWIDNLKL